jgi:hypothetical protein
MHPAGPLLLLAVLLPTVTPAQQKAVLPVTDIIRSERLDPGLEPETEAPRFDWIHRALDPGSESPYAKGEGTLLRGVTTQPWLDDDTLLEVLSALSDVESSALKVEDGQLIVDRSAATAVAAGLAQLRAQLPPPIDLDIHLQRVKGGVATTLLRARQAVHSGRTATFDDLVQRRILSDYDVEIAQAAATANPIVDDLTTGACLAVRPRQLPGKDEVLIEVFARVATAVPSPAIPTDSSGIGPIDRATREVGECGVAMRVPRGATRTIEWTAAGGDRLRLTCGAIWQNRQAPARTGAMIRCRSLYHDGIAEFRSNLLEPDAAPPAFPVEAAFVRAGAQAVRVIREKGSATGAVVVADKKAEQFDADIVARLVRRLTAAELIITVTDVPAGLDPAQAGDRARPLATIATHAVVGKSVALSGRTEARYVHDWDVEVAQSARIPDPKVRLLRHGYHLDARVTGNPDGGFAQVALDARFSRLDRIDVRKAVLCEATRAGGTANESGATTPAIVLPRQEVHIESPVLRTHSVSAILRLDGAGRGTLRRAAPQLLGDGRDLVLTVHVKR